VVLISASFPLPALAQDVTNEYLGIIISEIYPNAEGSERDGQGIDEFIELYNPTDTQQILANAIITKDNYKLALPSIVLKPDQRVAIFPKTNNANLFSLSNTGGTLTLTVDGIEVQTITYSSISETKSCATTRTDNAWVCETSDYSPASELSDDELFIDEDASEQTEDQNEDSQITETCDASDVTVTEILANPSGADTNGGEFVELYNSGDQDVSLANCWLHTDKQDKILLDGYTIKSKSYLAISLADKLLNNGGEVWLVATDKEDIFEYPTLKSDQSWVIIDGLWQLTDRPTPGAANLPNAPAQKTEDNEDEIKICPAGKYLNPATNRCKNIVTDAEQLVACKTGYERNPETNRCRKIATAQTSSLTPCKEGYERNPETNRCRKIASGITAKNDNTTDATPTDATEQISTKLLTPVAAFAMMFGLYEYKEDARNHARRLHKKFKK
jgi:hypothetical protein